MSARSWPRAVFERVYARHANPWGVGVTAYERRKYRQTLAILAGQRFDHALELGCSIGVMTARLARQCERLLAVDVSRTALRRARLHCMGLHGVSFYRGHLPEAFPPMPPQSCDLIVISEMLYFLSPPDIARLAGACVHVRRPGAPIVLVNWTGPTNTPCTGDAAARHFIAHCQQAGLQVLRARRHVGYRLDVLGEGPGKVS